jgi:UDP-N-acetylglucosamine 1-carboxyvinyltransferase
MRQAGVKIEPGENSVTVSCEDGLKGVDVMTEPYPGFPTDMQAQWMALMATADGASMITETIFENRFMHVPELTRFGAEVNVHGSSAIVRGRKKLSGAPVMATDLRASVSLILAGLAADAYRNYRKRQHQLRLNNAEYARVPAAEFAAEIVTVRRLWQEVVGEPA